MAEQCPICRTLEGKCPGRGKRCDDCESNFKVQAAYDFWPKQGISIHGYNVRMDKAKADLFVAKLAGGKDE